MSKGGTTCLKLSFFGNLGQFTEIYTTNVVPSQFWWVAEYGFNGMKHIFIQIFLHVEPHVDYIIQFCGKIYCSFRSQNTKSCSVFPL